MAILTISREYGSGGAEVGRQVAKALDYLYVDKERLFADLEKAGERWGRAARELDEVCPTMWERFDWEYRGYVARLEALLLDYAARDRVVIIGRGGAFLLREVPFCLRVRVVAPLEVRIERIMSRERFSSREAAARLVAKVDGERACYLQANYGHNWEEERLYDLTLSTGELTYEQVAKLLAASVTDKDRLATPEAKTRLAEMALAANLKARIATDPRLLVPTLAVEAREGVIAVTGIIHTPREEQLLGELARQVCGERPVRLELHRRV